jgi:hypothetical protein
LRAIKSRLGAHRQPAQDFFDGMFMPIERSEFFDRILLLELLSTGMVRLSNVY